MLRSLYEFLLFHTDCNFIPAFTCFSYFWTELTQISLIPVVLSSSPLYFYSLDYTCSFFFQKHLFGSSYIFFRQTPYLCNFLSGNFAVAYVFFPGSICFRYFSYSHTHTHIHTHTHLSLIHI